MNLQPAPTLVEALTPIWERVLQCSPIAPEDNFFKHGGNIPRADVLFAEIAKVVGRELPSAIIWHAPTIAALSAVLEQSSLPTFPPVVAMRTGGKQPPIFIAPGLEGCVRTFELARKIQTEHPIFGMYAKGINGLEEPLDRVEDMADFYLDSLKDMQPHGPYAFIGYSFGGLTALEMARRLSEKGEEIALLLMLDSYPDVRYLPLGMRAQLLAQRAWNHISIAQQMPAGAGFSYMFREITRRIPSLGRRSAGVRAQGPSRLSFARNMAKVQQKSYLALARYLPRAYRGRIRFVKAEVLSHFPKDPAAIWGKLSDSVEVATTPGDHLSMITTHSEDLAILLSRYLREAFAE